MIDVRIGNFVSEFTSCLDPSNNWAPTGQIFVHGCNAQGVMGSGVAGQLAAGHPMIKESYLKFIEQCRVQNQDPLGLVDTLNWPGLRFCNAITQRDFGRDGAKYVSYKAIQDSFRDILYHARFTKFNTINFPMIGAGLGGGEWSIIQTIIEETLRDHNTAWPNYIRGVLWILE